MAEPSGQRAPFLALPGFFLAATFVAGLAIYNAPLRQTRTTAGLPKPTSSSKSEATGLSKEDFHATEMPIWQDPFLHRASIQAKVEAASFALRLPYYFDPGGTRVLFVMVRRGQTTEDIEQRLRTRVAVVGALRAEGFVPRYDDIMYHLVTEKSSTGAGDAKGAIPVEKVLLPYEWFRQDQVAQHAGYTGSVQNVLVIYLPEGEFPFRNLRTIGGVLGKIEKAFKDSASRPAIASKTAGDASSGPESNATFALVGPNGSMTLTEIHRESSERQSQDSGANELNEAASKLFIYATTPTAEPFLMRAPEDVRISMTLGSINESFPKELKVKGFRRLCQTDDVLSQSIVDELLHRGLRIIPSSSEWKIAQANNDEQQLDTIALISDQSFYGRGFPQTFNAILWHNAEKDGKTYLERDTFWRETHSSRPTNVHIYYFPRGLDAPIDVGKAPPSDDKPTALNWLTAPSAPETVEGPGQLDYVRRLAQSLYEEHRRAGKSRLRAIGIIGADVHDKMLLLQALRTEFPDVLFFTTDLDARLIHYENFAYTRNLVIASSYGLALRDRYQRMSGIATFRDSNQTAAYVACRMAVSEGRTAEKPSTGSNYDYGTILLDAANDSLRHPIIFEIGREVAATLSPREQPEHSLHPPTRPQLRLSYWVFVSLGILLFLMLCVYVFQPASDQIGSFYYKAIRRWAPRRIPSELGEMPTKSVRLRQLDHRHWQSLLWVAAVSASGIMALLFLIPAGHYWGGEPFALTTGVSSWPSLAITHAAFSFSLLAIVQAWFRIRAAEFSLDEELKLRKSEPQSQWIARPRSFLIPLSVWHPRISPDGGIHVSALWRQYKWFSSSGNRGWRVGKMLLILALFWIVVYLLFGEPNEPARGAANLWTIRILKLLSLTTLAILTLCIVDSTSLIRTFVRNLVRGASHYEESTLRTFWTDHFRAVDRQQANAMDRAGLDRVSDLIDIVVIARLSTAINQILLYPFIALTLLILARSKLFDNFVWSMVLVAVYGMLSIYALWCAIMLQRAAESARRDALASASRKLDAARLSETKRDIVLYEAVIRQIRDERRGAFTPFYDNPILRAILLPTGGTTLIALLDYLAYF